MLTAGMPLAKAMAAMVLLHGRGARPEDICIDCEPLLLEHGFAFLAPGAEADAWYPKPFTAPLAENEPQLSAALARVHTTVEEAAARVGVDHVVVLGFSQGGCLALEYAARNPRRYGAIVGFSGALIGPPGAARDGSGSLAGTPVFLGCSDVDPHVSAELVKAAAGELGRLGGEVDLRFYPGMGHMVCADELDAVRRLMTALTMKEELTAWQ